METFRDPGLAAAAERAMRRWEIERHEAERSDNLGEPLFCITISREAGSRGSGIARLVGVKLGWTVYDQELLEYIAHEVHLRMGVFESLDEPTFDWSQGWLARLLGNQWQNQEDYIVLLAKVILAIGLHGEAIIVGRGAGCILPRDRSLNVRLIANDPDRISYISQTERLTPLEAERHMREKDEQRRTFVRKYFRRESADPHEYDLILDSSMLGEETCAEVIVAALRGKETFMRQQTPTQVRPSPVPAE